MLAANSQGVAVRMDGYETLAMRFANRIEESGEAFTSVLPPRCQRKPSRVENAS
jgi:hypothetical protein